MTEVTNEGPEQTGGQEEAPIVAVEEAAVKAAETAKAADDAAKAAKEQAELDLQQQQEKPKPESDWKDKELKKRYAKIKERERDLEAAQQRIKDLEELAARATTRDPETGKFVAAEPERAVTQAAPRIDPDVVKAEAQKLYQQDKFNEACAAAEVKGREVYKDEFEKAITTIQTLGGFDPETMVGILATDDPSKVLYELGKNPDEYHRIMELTPAKRIAEMTKMSITAAPKPKLSEAPAPVEQVGGRGGATNTELRDDMSDDEWNAIRDRQEKERWLKKTGRAA